MQYVALIDKRHDSDYGVSFPDFCMSHGLLEDGAALPEANAGGGPASWLTIPASTLMHSSVCPRANDRKSAGIFFRGKGLRGGPTPLLLAQASRPRPAQATATRII